MASVARSASPPTPAPAPHTRKHLRGSSLLLVGRVFALVVNFGIQVLIVRHLSKAEYGAFAYALTVVSVSTSFCLLGLNQANSRFLAMFQERGQLAQMWGTLVFTLGTSFGLGLVAAALVIGFQQFLSPAIVKDSATVGVLIVFIGLVPLNALDNLFLGILAVFAKPRAIFFRRHILAPGLKLAAVLTVMAAAGGARMLAAGYVIAGALGVAVYMGLFRHVLRTSGLKIPRARDGYLFPVRELLAFSVPLLLMDAFQNIVRFMAVLFLESSHDIVEVAEFRAVMPVARLSFIALQSLHLLFTPAASRLYARDEHADVGHLYWQTILWIATVSFPILALGSLAATDVSRLLFGEAYAGAGTTLAILTLGSYLCAAFSLGRYGLQVLGRVRVIVGTNIVSLGTGALLAATLIPPFGTIGAAIATSAAFITQGLLVHLVFLRSSHASSVSRAQLRVYASIAVAFLGLGALRVLTDLPFAAFVVVAALASLLVVRLNRHALEIERTFPEIGRIPVLGGLLGVRGRHGSTHTDSQ